MDVYRALNADVPQLLFTVLHQAGPNVSEEDFTRTVTALQMDIRQQVQTVGEKLGQWLEQEYAQQTGETARKLRRLTFLSKEADLGQVQDALVRDFQYLGSRIGSVSLLGLQGSADEAFREEPPVD